MRINYAVNLLEQNDGLNQRGQLGLPKNKPALIRVWVEGCVMSAFALLLEEAGSQVF